MLHGTHTLTGWQPRRVGLPFWLKHSSGPLDLISDSWFSVLFSVVSLLLVMAAAGALASCASNAELTLEQVATMLSGIIGNREIRAAGVVDTLHAAELVGMLKNAHGFSLSEGDQGRLQTTKAGGHER